MRLTFAQRIRLGEIISHNMTLEMRAAKIMQNGNVSDIDIELIGKDVDELKAGFEMFKMLATYTRLLEPKVDASAE